MPTRPPKRCPLHGPHPRGGLGCPICRRARQARIDRQRGTARERGYDTDWETTRAAYLAEHPNCERDGCPRPSRDVNHIDGLGPLGPRGHDHSNLEALCQPHHAEWTAQHQPGGWHRRGRDGARP